MTLKQEIIEAYMKLAAPYTPDGSDRGFFVSGNIEKKSIQIITRLKTMGENIEPKEIDMTTLLVAASFFDKKGNLVNKFLKRLPDVTDGAVFASGYGADPNIIRALIKNCKNVDNGFLASSIIGDLSLVNEMLSRGANVDAKNMDGGSAIDLAIFSGHFELARYILKKSNLTGRELTDALASAIHKDSLETVKDLLGKGAELNIPNRDGQIPIIFAFKNLDMVEYLLKNGANINATDIQGNGIMFYAVRSENLKLIKLLVSKGADLDVKNKDGYSVLYEVMSQEKLDGPRQELIKYLVDNGTNPNTGADVRTVYNPKGFYPLNNAIARGYFALAKYLIKKGAYINAADEYHSPLTLAVEKENFDLVKILIDKDANINTQNTQLYSPLSHAVNKKNLEIAKLLIQNGANINFKSEYGQFPLMAAVGNNDLNMIRYLIEHGANVNMKNSSDRTPLIQAVKNDQFEIAKYLLNNNANVNDIGKNYIDDEPPLTTALDLASSDKVRKLLIKHNGKRSEDILNKYGQ